MSMYDSVSGRFAAIFWRFAFVGLILLAVKLTTPLAHASSNSDSTRKIENFNRDWKLMKGDPAGAETVGCDDSSWQQLRLPHDWAIAGPFDPSEDGHAAKLPWKGVGWYRKSFALDAADAGRRVYLDFDGVMAFPKVYVNGHLAGEWDYGYTSFRIDATPFVKFGEPNEVAVRIDTTKHGTRWYPGAGIYRKVTLTTCDPVHLAHWGTFITTPSISNDAATVLVRLAVDNHRDAEANVSVEVKILSPEGAQVASGTVADNVPADGTRSCRLRSRWQSRNGGISRARSSTRPSLRFGPPVRLSTRNARSSAFARSSLRRRTVFI